ncbi:hypothetical protein Moror_5199 [Moniliophthora roreri MCA 2997]|uniref:DUF6535 domain-containing protein n=1 Tax=Moniliophthora roreri (strain MCA 2997) TaxID=1381753 RepID=V2X603_MONRO|nr:hypothetical protein Moror_5199 [Moniliophthora roreri MCA 2997]KAI3610156.1 hypothetical protein WG66_007377 [Moniliophthora roreri]
MGEGSKNATLDQSWEKTMKEVDRYDEDMVQGWKEDIDTLLVFAGLFSAVVTTFAIESYKWLSEDPAETTVTLLKQISQQLVNASQVPSEEVFEVDPSSVRINCFWVLSLIFSLTSSLFALLCKQWLREHRRDTLTRSQAETLALVQLRRDSLEKWGVASIPSALPILLEVSLLLFFAGLLELLWISNHIVFALATVAVGLSAGMYFITTVLPTIAIPPVNYWGTGNPGWDNLSSIYYVCPYKSPQAWAFYRFYCKFMQPLLNISFIRDFLIKRGLWYPLRVPAKDWSSLDLNIVRRTDVNPREFPRAENVNLRLFELRGIQWAAATFRDSPSMFPHLVNILKTLHPSVAMASVFGTRYWPLVIWEDITHSDVEIALKDDVAFESVRKAGFGAYSFLSRQPGIPNPTTLEPLGVQLLYYQQCCLALARNATSVDDVMFKLCGAISQFKKSGVLEATGLRFYLPFPVADKLWTHPDEKIRAASMCLLQYYEESWKDYPGEGEVSDERTAFIKVLAEHINREDCTSELVLRKRGQSFLSFINREILRHRLYQGHMSLASEWNRAMCRAQVEAGLPSDFFEPVPEDLGTPPPAISPRLDITLPEFRVSTPLPPHTLEPHSNKHVSRSSEDRYAGKSVNEGDSLV